MGSEPFVVGGRVVGTVASIPSCRRFTRFVLIVMLVLIVSTTPGPAPHKHGHTRRVTGVHAQIESSTKVSGVNDLSVDISSSSSSWSNDKYESGVDIATGTDTQEPISTVDRSRGESSTHVAHSSILALLLLHPLFGAGVIFTKYAARGRQILYTRILSFVGRKRRCCVHVNLHLGEGKFHRPTTPSAPNPPPPLRSTAHESGHHGRPPQC